jgi:hypothetical protein
VRRRKNDQSNLLSTTFAAVYWAFKTCEIWQDRFVGYGWIIKRKCAGKEAIAGNAVRVRRVNAGEHR